MSPKHWLNNIRISIAAPSLLWGTAIIPVSNFQKITNWDPAELIEIAPMRESATVFESLIGYTEDSKGWKLAPVLLEKMPSAPDRGGLRYRLKLKKNVKFGRDACLPEGREFVAADVVYSWNRLLDKSKHFGGAWALEGLIAEGGLKAVGKHELEVTLRVPTATFLYRVALPSTAIVPRECVEMYGEDFARHPVGTGPFRLVRDKTDYQARLYYEARDDYHVKGLPRSAGIDVRIFLESQPRWLSFESGALWISSIPKEQVKNARDNPKFVIVESAVPNVIRVSFNMDSAVLGAAAPQGLAIRHAISRALDREEYIRTFLDGEGEKAFGPVPPGVVGYSSGVKAAASTKPAGHPGATFKGTTVEFNSLGDSNWRQFSEWLTLKLAPLGITVKPVFLRAPEWRARIEKRQGDLWVERWSADYPDAESFLQLYYGKNKAPGANDSGYANPEFDRLYEKMLGEQRPAERTRLSLAMQKLLIRDAPAAWLTHETSRVALLARDGNRKNGPRLRALLHPFDYMTRKYMEEAR